MIIFFSSFYLLSLICNVPGSKKKSLHWNDISKSFDSKFARILNQIIRIISEYKITAYSSHFHRKKATTKCRPCISSLKLTQNEFIFSNDYPNSIIIPMLKRSSIIFTINCKVDGAFYKSHQSFLFIVFYESTSFIVSFEI